MRDYFQKVGESDLEFARRMQDRIKEQIEESKYQLKITEDYLDALVDTVSDLSNRYLDRDNLVYLSQKFITYDSARNFNYWNSIISIAEKLAKEGHRIHIIVAEEVEDVKNKRDMDEL